MVEVSDAAVAVRRAFEADAATHVRSGKPRLAVKYDGAQSVVTMNEVESLIQTSFPWWQCCPRPFTTQGDQNETDVGPA